MGANSKPGIDWPAIKARVQAGESYRAIAKTVDVSHVAISNKARKEGWLTGGKPVSRVESKPASVKPKPVSVVTPHLKAVANPSTTGERNIQIAGRRCPENLETIRERISQGRSETTAIAGLMDWNTWQSWKEADPQAVQIIDAARRGSLGEAEVSIYDAHERGDWKAGLARLQADKRTKQDWQDDSKGGVTINVSLNIPRAGDDAKVIEHE